jgi:hypothetical protein
LIALQSRRNTIKNFSPVILLEHLAVCNGCDSVIVELEPPTGSIRLYTSEIVTPVEIP